VGVVVVVVVVVVGGTYLPTMSRLIMAATLTELFLYVSARFWAPRRPCSSPAKAVNAIEVLGLYEAKIRASSRDTATPEALYSVSRLCGK
jgi:hypothetical protein